MKVSELKVTNDLAKLLSEVHVSGTGSNAKKALENMDGVSIAYSSAMKRVPILKDLKTGISIELSEQLELASLTQLSKELGFGGTAYQAGNLLNKNFMSVTTAKLKTSKDVFKESFDVERLKLECSDTLSELVETFIDLESLSEQDRKTLESQLSRVGLAFIHAEDLYDVIKLDNNNLNLIDYFLDDDYKEYRTLLTQESRFDSLPKEVQLMNEREDGYVLVKSDYMSVEDFITLQTKLKDVAVEGTLQISKTVAWADDGISVDSVAVTATLCLK